MHDKKKKDYIVCTSLCFYIIDTLFIDKHTHMHVNNMPKYRRALCMYYYVLYHFRPSMPVTINRGFVMPSW